MQIILIIGAQYLSKELMGNYCCADKIQEPPLLQPVMKKRPSLKDPLTKKKYEHSIGEALNTALQKFKGDRRVHSIRIKSRLGKGGQGEVFLVQVKGLDKSGDFEVKDYAMKRVSKKKLDAERTKQALMLENEILSSYRSNFLLQIVYAFQNSSELFYMMQIAQGGDIYSYISDPDSCQNYKPKLFEKKGEWAVKFLLAGIILGIQYLHSKGIVYRDLKPENILLFQDGYPKLADFGVAKKFTSKQKCYDLKGTVLYFSPEMTTKKGYDRGSDLWALGVLMFQLLFKVPPFTSSTIRSKNFQTEVINFQKNIKSSKISKSGINLIKKLLKLNPTQRIGYKNMNQLKQHQFFKDIDWQKYQSKQLQSPLKEIVEIVISQNIRKTEVINQYIETEPREDIPFNFVRQSATRQTTLDNTPGKKQEEGEEEEDNRADNLEGDNDEEEVQVYSFDEQQLDNIIDGYKQ